MKTGMFTLALGLLALRFLPALPSVGWLIAMLVLALMLLPFRTFALAFFLLGLSWACISAQWALNDRLQPALDGQTRWLEGRVIGLPQQTATGVRFDLADSRSRNARLPSRIRVSWHGGPAVRSGERWRLAVTLRRPSGLLNFHGFDHEAWLLAQRIGATGSVKDGERLTPARHAWRDTVRQRLLAVDAQGREAGLAALVLGDGSGLEAKDWQVLQDTGTVHLLVISGQHIGLLAGLIYGLVALLARYGCWPRAWPWLPWACGLAFAAALGYGVLAGFGVPVQRACVMVGLVLLWRLRFRHLGFWWPLLLALVAVLILEPLASLQAGFWLSFAAVAVLVLAFGGRLGLLECLAGLDATAMVDCHRFVSGAAGVGVADQRQCAAGQFGGCAVDQLGGVASGVAGERAVRSAPCRRVAAVAGGWGAGWVVQRFGMACGARACVGTG